MGNALDDVEGYWKVTKRRSFDDFWPSSSSMCLKSSPIRMYIEELRIENFKCFKGEFKLDLNEGLNVLVGDNETGKSTILEAIHLALTGMLNGRYLKNELTQYLFNREIVEEYIQKVDKASPEALPYILIEIFIGGDDLPLFEGDGNYYSKNRCGVSLRIAFNEKYKSEYEALVKNEDLKTIPIEYYDMEWRSCARDTVTTKSIPIKSALIDSSSSRYKNGSDVYISRIVRDFLDSAEVVGISQAHRKMKEAFMSHKSIIGINAKIKTSSKISHKDVKLSVDLATKNAWEDSLLTYLDDIPFHFVGKGEQCIVKTKLALAHKKAKEANVILLEEPENHLSHSRLNQLIRDIRTGNKKQILVSTHSSFVANKLGLENLILIKNRQTTRLNNLQPETKEFFQKLAGYDTLRLILCKKPILVEGDSDELIIQKAYKQICGGNLPIEDGIDIISVGTSFLRFLEIAKKLKIATTVVTDNDGSIENLKKKYAEYLTDKGIKICFDSEVDTGLLKIGSNNKPFNYNTLEPKIVKENGLLIMNAILETNYKTTDELHLYMRQNKTECALKIFDSKQELVFPAYILDAITIT